MRRVLVAALLLVGVFAPSVATGQSSAERELTHQDGQGDMRLRQGGPGAPVPIPSNPMTDPFDLLNLRVHGEDTEGFHVDVLVKSLRRPPGHYFSNQYYQLDFRLEGSSIAYGLEWSWLQGFSDPTNETPTFGIRFCLRSNPESYYDCNRQRAFGGASYADNKLFAYIPKQSLLGRDPLPGSDEFNQAVPLGRGSILNTFAVRAWSSQSPYEDRLPDSGGVGPFVLQEGVANDRIQVRLAKGNETNENPYYPYQYTYQPSTGEFPTVAVEAGNTTLVKVDVVNRNGAKRIVNLTARTAEPAQAGKWELRVAPSVQVPGNETRTVNLVVSAKDTVNHREAAVIKVHAKSLGFEDEFGALTLRLVASVPPTVKHPTLYFHAASTESGVFGEAQCGLPAFTYCSDRLWLNTLEEDSTASLDATGTKGRTNSFLVETRIRYDFRGESDLARDIVLDVKQPLKGTIKITPSAAAGSLQFSMRVGETQVGAIDVAVPANQAEIPVSFLPLIDAARLKAGTTMDIVLELRFPPQSIATPPRFIPKGSFVTLPIIVDPEAKNATQAPLGDAFLGLKVMRDKEEFVNPGRSRAFKLELVNEGEFIDDVDVSALVVSGECGPTLAPGDRFHLDPGDSVRFAVLVKVPEDAKETDQCKVQVRANSTVDPRVFTSLIVTTIATNGVDIPDDAGNYTVDDDSKSKVRSRNPDAGSPGAGFFVQAAVLMAVLFAVRRRRLQP